MSDFSYTGGHMEFVNIAEFRQNASKVFERLEKDDEVVILRNGRPVGFLVSVEASSLDVLRIAFHRARAQLAAGRLRSAAIRPKRITQAIQKTRRALGTEERARAHTR